MLAALDLREFGYVCNSLSVFRVAVIIRVPQKWGPLIPCAKECLCIIFIENRWSLLLGTKVVLFYYLQIKLRIIYVFLQRKFVMEHL